MTLKEYKENEGKTLRELHEELKGVDKRFTLATVSYMVNEVVGTPDNVGVWLAEKQIEKETEPLTEAEDIVLRCLTGHTKDDPMSRSDLKYWSGLPDRVARDAIEGLRRRGYWIVNGTNGGYYITFNRAEMEAWLVSYTSRARTINKVATAMRAADPEQIAI